MSFKFNGGRGAVICDACRVIVAEDLPPLKNWERCDFCSPCATEEVPIALTREDLYRIQCLLHDSLPRLQHEVVRKKIDEAMSYRRGAFPDALGKVGVTCSPPRVTTGLRPLVALSTDIGCYPISMRSSCPGEGWTEEEEHMWRSGRGIVPRDKTVHLRVIVDSPCTLVRVEVPIGYEVVDAPRSGPKKPGDLLGAVVRREHLYSHDIGHIIFWSKPLDPAAQR